MAGKVAKYGPVSVSFGTGKGNTEYREDPSGSGNGKNVKPRSGSMMEEYWSNFIDEDVILKSLGNENEREKALRHLDRQFHENNSLLIFQKKVALFRGFAQALCDKSVGIRIECTKLIVKILPQLGPDLEQCMNQVLPKIVSNIGNCTALQKESIQTLHICMKHSDDVYQILKFIAENGIKHKDPKTRKQIIHSFPTLLFPEFKHEDFFDIVKALAFNLNENDSDNSKVMKTMSQVKRFVGKPKFVAYVKDLPPTLQSLYNELALSTEANFSTSSTPALPLDLYANGELHQEDVGSSSQTPRDYSRIDSLASFQDFGKSGYFDSVTMKNSLGKGYRSRPKYLSTSRSPDTLQAISPHYEFGFISKSIIEKLSSNDNKTRHQAVEDLKATINNLRDVTPLKQNIIPLISLLQPAVEDNNYKVSCSALQTLDVIVKKIGSDMRPYVKLVANAVGKRLGTKDVIRSECMKVLLHLEEVVDPGTVVELFWLKMQHKQAKIREETINFMIASLLRSPINTSTIDVPKLSSHLAPMLIDPKPRVRLAALECIAVIASLYGVASKNFQHMISAVDHVELLNDEAAGIMSAVQARLVRKQLPRLRENMLVEYAIIPTTTASITSPQAADINWVLAVTPKNSNTSQSSMSQFSSSMNSSFNSSTEGNDPNDVTSAQQRRYLSAGKQRMFPWARDESDPDQHPSSAPVQTQRNNLGETHPPPVRPRNTWGPESEKVPSSIANLSQQQARGRANRNDQGGNSVGYLEIHRRRQENAIKESVTNIGTSGRLHKRLGEESTGQHSAPVSNMGRNMSSVAGTGGYQPSFGSTEGTARNQRPNQASMKSQPQILSNSCPTTFFDENNQVKRFNKSPRRSPLVSVANDSPNHKDTDDPTEPESPIRLKPQLARMSAKRRGSPNANAAAYENGSSRGPEALLTVQTPMKMKNSASPRLDRIADNPTVDKVRPIIKQSRNHNQLEQRLSKDLSDILDSVSGATLPGTGYTPSSLQHPSHVGTQPLAVIRHPSHHMKSSGGAQAIKHHPDPSGFVYDDDRNDANNNYVHQQKQVTSNHHNFDAYGSDPIMDLPGSHPKPKADPRTQGHEMLKGTKSLPAESYNVSHPRLQQQASSPIQSDTPRTAPRAGVREEDVPYKSSMDLIRHSAQKKRNQMQRSMSYGREGLDGSFSSTISGPTSGRATAPEVGSNVSGSPSTALSPISNKTNSHSPSPTQSNSRDSLDGMFINGFQSSPNRRSSRTDSEPSSTYSNDTGYVSTIIDPRKMKKSGKIDAEGNPFMTKPSIARPGSGRSNGGSSQGNSLAVSREPSSTDPPPFKYNPNSGVSFNTNKTKSNVSVVGFGYGPRSPLASDAAMLGSSPLGTPTNSSTSLTASPSSSNLSSKPSSTTLNTNLTSRERRKNQRGSSLGMAPTQMPGSVLDPDDDFNIKGKAIRDQSSTNLSEAADLSPTPSKDEVPWSSHSSESVNKHPPAGVYGKAVRHPSASSDVSNDENNYGGRQTETVPLSASLLAHQFKKKEDLEQYRKTKTGKMKQKEELPATSQMHDTFPGFNIENKSPTGPPPIPQQSQTKSKSLRKSRSPNTKVSPPRAASLDRKSSGTGNRDSSALRTTSDILPCPNPESNLNDAITRLQNATTEEWEEICNHIHTFRRLATFHQDVLALRMHEVLTLLCTNVRNLRSQVSRAAVVCLTDVYTHMKRPAVDIDIEVTTKALLTEHGSKKGVFMQEEILKTFQYIVANVTSVKVLNGLLAAGSGNRNRAVRDITSQFVCSLVEKMGPGKVLSGIKDTTEKIIPAVASFITDSSHDTRYYGRRIVNELMTHQDFERCVDKYLNSKQAQEMKDAVQMIKTRGVGSIGSAGSHKNPGSGVRRNGSTRGLSRTGNSTAERLPQISSNSSRRKGTPAKSTYNDQDQEEIRVMCVKLSQGDMLARKESVKEFIQRLSTTRPLIEDNIIKIMDSYISLLTTSNAKLNLIGLENLVVLIPELNNLLPIQSLVSAVCRLLVSKQHSDLAARVVGLVVEHLDPMVLLQQFANSAMYSPVGKSKLICIEKLSELVAIVSQRKPQAVERHVLPVLWNLFSEKNAANLKRETTMLARALYNVMGDNLLQYAESRNLSGKIKDMVSS